MPKNKKSQPNNFFIGAHFSVAGGFIEAFRAAHSMGASSMQIFTKSPMMAKLREVTKDEAAEIANWKERKEIKSLVIHASYLLNFAKKIDKTDYAMKSLVEDLENAEKIGAEGVVLHMGKTLKSHPALAEKLFVENIETALKTARASRAKVILENTAGQGSEMGYLIEEYARIFNKIRDHKRLGICLDTAHLFAAGYDLRKKEGVEKFLDQYQKVLDWPSLVAIHFNDSKKPLLSRVDRHEDIGRGTIGEEGLKEFVMSLNVKRSGLGFILETPQTSLSYQKQIEKIKAW